MAADAGREVRERQWRELWGTEGSRSSSAGCVAGSVAATAQEPSSGGRSVHLEIDEFCSRATSEFRYLLTGAVFLLRMPCPGWHDSHPGYLLRATAWLPLLGAIMGAWCAVFADATAVLFQPAVSALASMAASAWLTGCLQEEGLSNTANSFRAGLTKKEILQVMKDGHMGARGVVAAVLLVMAKVHLLAGLGPSEWAFGASTGLGPALVASGALARCTAAPLLYCCPYAVGEDDAKSDSYSWFARRRDVLGPCRVGLALALGAVVPLLLYGPGTGAGAPYLAALLGASFVGAYSARSIGGLTGDVLGAASCLAELSALAVLTVDSGRLRDAAAVANVWWAVLRPLAALTLAAALPCGRLRCTPPRTTRHAKEH
mmetsp:Transcript_112548/g.363511  ORF Transcript_112548/g.363511 Transcript_112548/m.363511 type:complete len:374 (-) Transcript_112548:128-1249(-)